MFLGSTFLYFSRSLPEGFLRSSTSLPEAALYLPSLEASLFRLGVDRWLLRDQRFTLRYLHCNCYRGSLKQEVTD